MNSLCGLLFGRGEGSSSARPTALLLLLLLWIAAVATLAQAPANATAPPADATPTASPTAAAAAGTGKSADRELVLYGTGSYGTLVNLFFTLSALFTDILIIRVWLVLAYIFLAVNVLMNFPDITVWDTNSSPHKIILGTLVWTLVTLSLQLWALVILVLDELPVKLSGDDEVLWRMFYRRCGMPRKEFQHVLKLGTWQQFKAGELVEQRDKDEPRLYVVFKGCLHLAPREIGDSAAPDALPRKGGSSATNAQQHTATASGTSKDTNSPTSPYNQQPVIAIPSGTLANLYLFNLFGICIGFEKDADDKALLLAATDVTLFSWDVTALLKISSGEVSIALPAYFRSLALYLVSFEFCRLHLGEAPYSSSGAAEPDAAAWLRGEVQSSDFTTPLGPEELPKAKFWGAVWALLRSFNLTIPRGLRHVPVPKTGAMARSRVLLAAHMRRLNQQLPAALAQDKAVVAAEGLGLWGASRLPTKLQSSLSDVDLSQQDAV
uniref:Cyclic nucleotide-binding domain-containing protein n=1 Tax=Tetradesmus obliquus TaxID=3088 RepID=A0A383W0F0_TETOB|eukprot:jgi/Sobl393_1/11961/SZX70136.1